MIQKLSEELYYIGENDRRLSLFENIFPIPNGVSYNSYIIKDEQTALLDTADSAVCGAFLKNVEEVLGGKELDYLIINHMEPDHAAAIAEVLLRYPKVQVVGNAKTFPMINQFFGEISFNTLTVAEGDKLNLGKHELTFVMAPMVHWPEVMVTFDLSDGTLFSADAFGTFGALSGSVRKEDMNFDDTWVQDARRYYTNIVGKYGAQVQALLKKAAGLEIKTVCPLHGPVWSGNDIAWLIEKYDKWSRCEPEDDDILIAYASMYGNTEKAAHEAAAVLSSMGRKTKLVNICATDKSYLIADMFRVKDIILACPTYNGNIYPTMEALVLDMKALMLKDRNIGIIENGSWGPTAARQIKAILETMKGMDVKATLSIRSALKPSQKAELTAFCEAMK